MTSGHPSLTQLDALLSSDPHDLCGLIHEFGATADGTPAHECPPTQSAYVTAVFRAANAAMAGRRPDRPREVPPTWTTHVVREHLAAMAAGHLRPGGFAVVWALERLGIVQLAPTREYVLAFVCDSGCPGAPSPLCTELLRADAELLERCFWPMFTLDGGAHPGAEQPTDELWHSAVVNLVADGTVHRSRALDACLDALCSGRGAFQSAWFTDTFAALHPSASDLARRQDRLVDLVGSPVGATVSFAVSQLVAVDAAGLLDDDLVAHRLGPAVTADTRTAALGGLRLLAAAARRRPDLSENIRAAVQGGVSNARPDMRDCAAALLARVTPLPQ